MAIVRNSTTLANARVAAQTQTSVEDVPHQLAGSMTPTIECNPLLVGVVDVVQSQVASNTTAATVYTTPTAGQDFYLTSVNLSYIKDATSDSTFTNITAQLPNGQTQGLIRFAQQTLTAGQNVATVQFPRPIQLKRGSVININHGTATGNILAAACITGFLVYNANG